jgi:hypothetical protein
MVQTGFRNTIARLLWRSLTVRRMGAELATQRCSSLRTLTLTV